MVGVFDRVFETAPVFRAEKHNTKRHLNEYTSLDFEMGYIDGFEDIMEMETGFLQYTMELLKTSYAKELELLKIKLPDVASIPRVRFDEAKQRVAEAKKLGFGTVVLPEVCRSSVGKVEGINLVYVSQIRDAIGYIMKK